MNRKWEKWVILCLCILMFHVTAYAQKETTIDVKEITVQELKDDMQVIDTRHPNLYLGWKNEKGVGGHIKNAMDFPVTWFTYEPKSENIDIELQRRKIDKTKPVVLYADDEVDQKVVDRFKKQGFTDIFILKGGINAYAKENKELEKLPGYKMYVSPQWVEDLINGKKPEGYNGEKYQIVEINLPKKMDQYSKEGHIKGAINLSSDDINHVPGYREISEYDGVPMEEQLKLWNKKPDAEIKKVLEENGITSDTMVILYADASATTAANRAALVMDYAGVKNIKLVNGGKELWKLENRKLSKDEIKPKKVDFGIDVPKNKNVFLNYEQELKLVDDKNAVLASVRSFDEYLCKISGYTYIAEAGDIKNSRFAYAGSDPYAMEDFRNLDNTMFNYKIVEDRWKRWGITQDKMVSFHCGTGWRASETYYIAKALGWKDIAVYDGGWYEWHKKEGSPRKEKGLPKDAPEQKPEEYFYKK